MGFNSGFKGLKEDGFLLILHVMRLSNRSGNLFWTSEERAYTKPSFKALAIMTGLKNNLHQGCTNSGQRFARATNFLFFFFLRLTFAGPQCVTCSMS